jgi:glycine/D-amino acid oxidase-like deaminating enzyme
MGGLPAIAAAESYRVRRWDAVILGGALPGLVAAIRLAKRGARILVLEEDRALAGFQGMREPFFMTGAGADQPLGACLRALGVPLIDQRRFAARSAPWRRRPRPSASPCCRRRWCVGFGVACAPRARRS